MNARCSLLIEMTRNRLGLSVFQAKAMQKRDQSRAAVVLHAQFRLNPGADLTRRTRRSLVNPNDELLLLRWARTASAAASIETHKRLAASLGERAMPATDRIVVQQKHPANLLAAHTVVEQYEGVGATRQSVRY